MLARTAWAASPCRNTTFSPVCKSAATTATGGDISSIRLPFRQQANKLRDALASDQPHFRHRPVKKIVASKRLSQPIETMEAMAACVKDGDERADAAAGQIGNRNMLLLEHFQYPKMGEPARSSRPERQSDFWRHASSPLCRSAIRFHLMV